MQHISLIILTIYVLKHTPVFFYSLICYIPTLETFVSMYYVHLFTAYGDDTQIVIFSNTFLDAVC